MSEHAALNVISSKYVASAVRADQYPKHQLPEFAWIGRSNVGKSSLINSLCRRHGLARTSSTPGKTQTLNFYAATAKRGDERVEFMLVDLPGYGYAKAGRSTRTQWGKFIEEYLITSERLKLVFQLIDIRHAPMETDIAIYQWLTENNLPVQIIATKADKIARGQYKKHADAIKKGLGMSTGEVIIYSAEENYGRDVLINVINQYLC